MNKTLTLLIAMLSLIGCAPTHKAPISGLNSELFRGECDGKPLELYTITAPNKELEVCISNFGARVVSIMTPDRNGAMQDVVLGFDNIEDYRHHGQSFGATVGRYANRIADAKFSLDGKEYHLTANSSTNCLHGGTPSWREIAYDVTELTNNSIELAITSPDGDNGFPGEVDFSVRYSVTDDRELKIEYLATTDAPTVINITNHSFFCLSGDGERGVMDDILWIDASHFAPSHKQIPTGELCAVADTPMDFNTPRAIAAAMDMNYKQIEQSNGYDHAYILNTSLSDAPQATLYSAHSGIKLSMYTSEPTVHLYTTNSIGFTEPAKRGAQYQPHAAVCLETQHLPNSPNNPNAPTTRLSPDSEYRSTTCYKFSVE